MATVEALVTLEEFAAMPDNGVRTELVRGRIIKVPPPGYLHGQIVIEIASLLRAVVKRLGLGRVIGGDSGIITHRNPDTLRGADVAYYSAAKIPPEGQKKGYPNLPPDLVIEVRSPSDRGTEIVRKVEEYLAVGVLIVVVLDPDTRSAHMFEADRPTRVLGPDDTLTFPDLLGDFAVVVGQIFE